MGSLTVDKENPLPLYIQVREDIRSQIERGELQPGHRLLFEDDLASRYNVSNITIKHALRDLADEGLIVRIKRKGTFVSPRNPDRPVSRQISKTLSLVIPDIEDSFVSEIYSGVAEMARSSGYKVTILSSDRQLANEVETIQELGAWGEAGAIIFPNWGRTNAEQIFELKRRKFPFVLVNRFFRDIETDYVVADNRTGAYQATEYLIQLGHRRIGCIGWVESTAVEDRLDGYRRALGRHGIVYEEILVRSIFDENPKRYAGIEPSAGGYNEMKALLSLDQPPTAVFAVSDRLAVGAMRAIREAGLSIPSDLALVGFDDVRYAADVDLTTVAQPAFKTGETAAKILIDRIENSDKHSNSAGREYKHVVLPTKLIIRGSSGGPLQES